MIGKWCVCSYRLLYIHHRVQGSERRYGNGAMITAIALRYFIRIRQGVVDIAQRLSKEYQQSRKQLLKVKTATSLTSTVADKEDRVKT